MREIDSFVLAQGRLLQRRDRALNAIFVRLAAALLTSSPKQFLKLVRESQLIANKESRHIYDLKQRDKPRRKTKK